MPSSPGTVSRILWHFTGGPRWNELAHRQTDELRPPEDGYKALVGILTSKELRIGRIQERIDVEMTEAQRLGIGAHPQTAEA